MKFFSLTSTYYIVVTWQPNGVHVQSQAYNSKVLANIGIIYCIKCFGVNLTTFAGVCKLYITNIKQTKVDLVKVSVNNSRLLA